MPLDTGVMTKIAHGLYLSVVHSAYGDIGVSVLQEVLENVRILYQHITPDLISGSIVVFKTLDDDSGFPSFGKPECFTCAEHLAQEYPHDISNTMSIIQICRNRDFQLWKNIRQEAAKLATLSENAIVYVYRDRYEYFLVRGKECPIFNPFTIQNTGVFAIPTFHELNQALEDYKRHMIRTSQCKIFSETWDKGVNGDCDDRLFFVSGPEWSMRDSLSQWLQTVLRNVAEVRPEQNVDESHPVDIKIIWSFSKHLALIEIKWLGKSIKADRNKFVTYTAVRAREGAKQLSDYLDKNRSQAPTHQTMGYLVVIDGRRRGLNLSSVSVNKVNGLYYRDKEINYDPEYHRIRPDFAEPVRMFAEPVCRPD